MGGIGEQMNIAGVAVDGGLDDRREFSLVRQHRRMLANMNWYLSEQSRILDFGCGDGQLVYEYRDAGFDAYGFDIRPSPSLRKPEDAEYFGLSLTGKAVNIPEFAVDRASYRIPYSDASFDFVYSTSTLEHVLDFEAAMAETARVLKAGGVALHTCPARFVPIEPHLYVPFGGAVRSYAWYRLWAALGVRNEFQSAMSPAECARNNLHYARTGLNYLPVGVMVERCRQFYRTVQLVPRLWELSDQANGSWMAACLVAPKLHRLATWVYSRCKAVVLFLRK